MNTNRPVFKMPFISKLAHIITKESLIGCVGFDYKITYGCTYKLTKEFLDVLHEKYLHQIVNSSNPLKEAYFIFVEENMKYKFRLKMRRKVFLYASNFDKLKFLKEGGIRKMINDEFRGKAHIPVQGFEKLYESDMEEAIKDVPYNADPVNADPVSDLNHKLKTLLASKTRSLGINIEFNNKGE